MDALSAISRTQANHCRRGTTARRATWVEFPATATFTRVPSMMCPTCLAGDDPALDTLPGAHHPGVAPATCPTCAVSSIEYGLTLAIDATLADMIGLDRLDGAL